MDSVSVASQTITANSVLTRLSGRFAEVGFEMLEEEFGKLLDSGVLGVVLEASEVESASSAVIGAILNMDKLLSGRKGKLVLAAPSPNLLALVDLLGIRDRIAIVDTAETGKKTVSSLQ